MPMISRAAFEELHRCFDEWQAEEVREHGSLLELPPEEIALSAAVTAVLKEGLDGHADDAPGEVQ